MFNNSKIILLKPNFLIWSVFNKFIAEISKNVYIFYPNIVLFLKNSLFKSFFVLLRSVV